MNLTTTPKVQYTYADGAENTVRPTALVYPNGRELHYDYGSTGEMNDAASRVSSLIDDDGTTHLVDYSYLGRGIVVEQESPQPDLLYTLVSLTSSNDPDTGDIYAGLDRFGRVKDLRWRNTNSNTDLSRVEYGYNRASNRIWRRNPTDPNAHYDWLYTYDAIQRLKSGERGTLNSNGTEIADPQFAQCWSLDATGNWRKFLEDDNGDQTWNLNQTRTSSTVNEITNITETAGPSWVTPAYSKAGNMTTIPQPADPTASFTATYDAWNRLTKLSDGTDTVQENVYDGRNFRVIQKTYADGDLDETRQYYFTNNWQIIEERLDSSSTPDRHFVWGIRYIDDLIRRDRSESGILDERLYPLPDANWNVTALVNTSGAVAERIEYDPYGQTTWLSTTFVGESSSQNDWETTYCSYRHESNTGLFHVRHRNYHPTLGTWPQRDPQSLSNPYSLYSYKQPLDMTDPLGMAPLRTPVKPRPANPCIGKDDECKIQEARLICRTMPAARHTSLLTHCYMVFTDAAGDVIDVFSGQNLDGPLGLSDTKWDKDYFTGYNKAKQWEYPVVAPSHMSLCDVFDCMYREASAMNETTDYNLRKNNSNTFLSKMIEPCGSDSSPVWRGFLKCVCERMKCLRGRELGHLKQASGNREDAHFVVPVVAAPVRRLECLFHSQPETTQQTIPDRQRQQ